MNKPIFVTQPLLPPLEEFIPYLEKIWDNKILTNGGEMHQLLEERLAEFLGVDFISLFSNGTIALITALKALDIKGEVITTPYSFVATAHSLLWNHISPVFADISEDSLNIIPDAIEKAISDKTQAIMPVHVYGNPCDVHRINEIAEKYKLKVIYDAAHSFAVDYKGSSILKYGDLSVLSFHATKIFNTFEGGAIICNTLEMKKHIDDLKNFGFRNETTVVEAGINGKMSEISAAFGLLQLDHFELSQKRRSEISKRYIDGLEDIVGIQLKRGSNSDYISPNNSYFPILITEKFKISRDDLYFKLRERNINARRYFYPLISSFEMYKNIPSSSAANLPVATKISNQILCLPIYPNLENKDVDKIISTIRE